MKKFIVIPDKFKGTISALEFCEIANRKIKEMSSESQVISIPVSDGGEGLVDTFLSVKPGKKVFADVCNPYMERISAYYGLLEDGTAVIEVSQACGLFLVEGRRNTKKATTYGVGELILHAQKMGVKKIYLGLGGTSTTDAGAGMMAALGVKFFDKSGKVFIPTGGTLLDIAKIDFENLKLNIPIDCLTDSLNPLYGPNGAAFVYAKQKGVSDADIPVLDAGLKHYSKLICAEKGNDKSLTNGTGAAGGIGFSVISLLNGSIKSGIEQVLKIVDFEDKLKDANFVITGEGKFDRQSLLGKAVFGIAKLAKKQKVPVILIAGCIKDCTNSELEKIGITAAFSTNRSNYVYFDDIKRNATNDLEQALECVLKLIL